MTKEQETILILIRAAITGQVQDICSDIDWNKAIKFAKKQEVSGLCAGAAGMLPKEQQPSLKEQRQWLGKMLFLETKYLQQWEVACKLGKLWDSVGIKATVLKGRAIAQYYPEPSRRFSCDIDVFVSDKSIDGKEDSDWKTACKELEAKGIKLEYEVYKEVEFTYDNVYVELHRYITPVRGNKNLLEFERYLRSLLDAEPKTFEDSPLIAPPLMFTALLYVEHAIGDFLRAPLKLKQVADWMVLRRQPIPWQMFNDKCKEFGLWRFLQLLNAFADVIEGKIKYEDLSETYKRAFDEIFEKRKLRTGNLSWRERRRIQFFNVLKCGWKYKAFGYMSISSYLLHTLYAHWFDKEVKI